MTDDNDPPEGWGKFLEAARRRVRYYLLDGHKTVPATFTEWVQWTEATGNDNRVAFSDFGKRGEVSTVFLGLDHNHWGNGEPLLFETMIFGGQHNGWQERCTTWEQAEAMHARAVALVMPLRLVN